MDKILVAFGIFVMAALTFIGIYSAAALVGFYYAWACSILWGWFVVTAFGLPQLSAVQMWGLLIFFALFRPKITLHDDDGEKSKKWGTYLTTIALTPLISLFFGYIVKTWFL